MRSGIRPHESSHATMRQKVILRVPLLGNLVSTLLSFFLLSLLFPFRENSFLLGHPAATVCHGIPRTWIK